ncbi:hypothetical protein NDU88_001349 [Pleurodeles waltl]|uniref:Uncharacterized protein n=1 Tax=Pleurodeles waltl TaxID=8319 RepID=A0AAV7ND50_PLEWA|nr:hypothetical protein NDU88_001349 [Pleurodeles waltl]
MEVGPRGSKEPAPAEGSWSRLLRFSGLPRGCRRRRTPDARRCSWCQNRSQEPDRGSTARTKGDCGQQGARSCTREAA